MGNANLPKYSTQYIMDLLNTPITFEKGRDYFNDGRVVGNIVWDSEHSVFYSTVQGTYLYHCTLWFNGNKLVNHSCDCPAHSNYTGPCKHIVATMLAISSREQRAAKEGKSKTTQETAKKDKGATEYIQEIEKLKTENRALKEKIKELQGMVESLQTQLRAEQEEDAAADMAVQLYEEGEYARAFPLLQETARLGYSAAQYYLAECYYWGSGVAQDYKQAVDWYKQAAEQEDEEAQYSLAWCYQHGEGTEKRPADALKWYTKAAKQGHVDAQFDLAECYYWGSGVAQDYKQAIDWYKQAAEQGHADAQFRLAGLYKCGNGVAQDDEKATALYLKAAAQGNAEAQYVAGFRSEFGIGVTSSLAEAIRWYHKAAEQGNKKAIDALKRQGEEYWIYEEEEDDCEPDVAEADQPDKPDPYDPYDDEYYDDYDDYDEDDYEMDMGYMDDEGYEE